MSAENQTTTARRTDMEAIVIGGSAGVLDVLRVVLGALPESLCVPVVLVVHVPQRVPTSLHESLQPVTRVPMQTIDDKEPLRGGRIYVAPPGYHLLIEADRCAALSLDEPVYYSRPSIDVLFESACEAYAGALMGILLTGASADGAEGLRAIRAANGITVVQDPQTSEASTMPASALELFTPDYVLPPHGIASLLARAAPSSSSSIRLL